MYFTDEEKEIIQKIAMKNKYSLHCFFEDNFNDNFKLKSREKYGFFIDKNWPVYVYENEEIIIIKNEQIKKLNHYIKLITILREKNFLIEIDCGKEDVLKNLRNFGEDIENTVKIGEELVLVYKKYIEENSLVIQSDLQQFVNDGFKTKDELRIEEEINARNEALKDAKWSFIVSIILAVVSIAVSVIPLFKDDKVIVKNQINTQQLEAQLKQNNQELKDIKTKLEELQKQMQKSTKK